MTIHLDRNAIFKLLLAELNYSLKVAKQAVTDAHTLATHEQSKPETQYDTVGLEAAYLAHGQSQRVAEISAAINDWQRLAERSFSEESAVSVGAIIQVAESGLTNDEEVPTKSFVLGNFSGGLKLQCKDLEILVISTNSPIGLAITDKCVGDEFRFPNQPDKWFEVISIT